MKHRREAQRDAHLAEAGLDWAVVGSGWEVEDWDSGEGVDWGLEVED